jgi:hypothetical protein
MLTLTYSTDAIPRGGRVANQIPADILEDPALNEAIKIVLFKSTLSNISYHKIIISRYIKLSGTYEKQRVKEVRILSNYIDRSRITNARRSTYVCLHHRRYS